MATQYAVRKFRKKRAFDRGRQEYQARMRAWQRQLDHELRVQKIVREMMSTDVDDTLLPKPSRPWWRRIFHNKKEDS